MKTTTEIEYRGRRIGDAGPQPVTVIERVNGIAHRTYPLRQRIIWHSPDGFQWGYGGSAPSDLALNLLLHATGDEETARALHQRLKWAFVAGWGDEWSITQAEVLAWVGAQVAQEVAP